MRIFFGTYNHMQSINLFLKFFKMGLHVIRKCLKYNLR